MTRERHTGTRAAFGAAVADFDELGRQLWEPIGRDTVTAADPGPGQRVLDACCGTGASAIPAARLVGADGVVDAVDVSGPMIARLRRNAKGLPQLRAHEADVTTWHRDGRRDYDVVQCALGIFFFPDMTEDSRRLAGLVRGGGRAAFTIWRGDAMAGAGTQVRLAVADVLETAPPTEREPGLYDRINNVDGFATWLAGLGLADVAVTVYRRSLPMTPELAWLVVRGSGYRGALSGLADDTVARVRERYLARLRAAGVEELDASTLVGTGTVVGGRSS